MLALMGICFVQADLCSVYCPFWICLMVQRAEALLLVFQPGFSVLAQGFKVPQLALQGTLPLSLIQGLFSGLHDAHPLLLCASYFLLNLLFLGFLKVLAAQTLASPPELQEVGVSFGFGAHDGLGKRYRDSQ